MKRREYFWTTIERILKLYTYIYIYIWVYIQNIQIFLIRIYDLIKKIEFIEFFLNLINTGINSKDADKSGNSQTRQWIINYYIYATAMA